MWERDNLRAGISILETSLFTLIVNLFGVKRRDGQDGRRESRLVSKEIVHLKLKSDIKKLVSLLKADGGFEGFEGQPGLYFLG